MDTFITSIKRKYQERLINREKQWPPCHSKKLVRLELVETERGIGYSANRQRLEEEKMKGYQQSRGKDESVQRTPLTYSDLFKVKGQKNPVRKVLVEGDAGIGKTTFCTSVSEEWANGKLFEQFELVLLLPLRYKEIASAGSLSELLKLLHSSERIRNSVASYLEEEEGEKVLIIADGWDELGESERQEGSFLYKLFFQWFSFISVLLTSRSSASAQLHHLPYIDQFVKVRGFSKENIKEYIQSEFTSDKKMADSLFEHLESNPLVENVCSVPLSCTIVCHLWHINILEEAFPTTMTELYTKITLNVILRNICKVNRYNTIKSLSNFDTLPKDLQQSWWLLCEFAFQAMKKNQLVFSQEELVEFFPEGLALDEKILCFGLLQCTESVFETGCGVSFHFLHLTFQEYLAALHLVKQPPNKQLEVFHGSDTDLLLGISTVSSVVLRFYFGIKFYNYEIRKEEESHVEQIIQYVSSLCTKLFGFHPLLLCHCAFEARNKVITDKFIQYLEQHDCFKTRILINDMVMMDCDHPHCAHDCAAVLYVIANMQICSGMEIDFHSSGVRENQIRTLTDVLASKHGKLQVASLTLHGNGLTDNTVSDLFYRASASFQSLKWLDLGNNRIRAESINSITTALRKSPSSKLLKYIDLSHNSLGISGLQMLEDTICSSSFANLKQLHLQGSLTSDADISSTQLTSFLEAVSAHCYHLELLDLSQNRFLVSAPVASALARIVSCNNFRLQLHPPSFPDNIPHYKYVVHGLHVYLSATSLGDKGLCTFVECLEVPCQFTTLDLACNAIHATGVLLLADSVCSGKTVLQISYPADPFERLLHVSKTVGLHLDDNPLGLEGTKAIGRMLSSNHCLLTKLTLSECLLTTALGGLDSESARDIGQQLCQIPHCNCTIERLNLNGNSLTGESIYILAGFMHLCPFLVHLTSSDCGISSDDLKQLLDRLAELNPSSPRLCSKLKLWNLEDNKIDDSGVSALMDHMPSLFPRLGFKYGIGNHVTNVGVMLSDSSVSSEMMRRLKEEIRRRQEVRCYFKHALFCTIMCVRSQLTYRQDKRCKK